MKKKILFLMTIICIFGISIKNVNAKTQFYEAEKIENIWTKSIKGKTAHFQKARFYRRTSDNKPAYCVEPFTFFKPEEEYTEYLNPENISKETWEKITLIAHFGYGYKNHQEEKWYAITQLMIWKEADPDAQYFFTDYLNGNKIDIFIEEQKEIYRLIDEYKTKPTIKKEIDIVEKQTIELHDEKNVLNKYKIKENNKNIQIIDNKLIINSLNEGVYNLTLIDDSELLNESSVYYYNPISQNLMTSGSITPETFNIKINVEKTELNIIKIDNITKTSTPSGDAIIEGTTYELYNQKREFIDKLTINKEGKAQIKNIPYGKYILKEIIAGEGYNIDEQEYEINIDKNNKIVNIKLENKVIEKQVNIHKEYSNTINSYPEQNITFIIYNKNNEIVEKITTNEFGNAKIKLPFGTYKIIQDNTTEGYEKIEPFTITINEKTEETLDYNLTDYKIKVPNTYSNKKNRKNIIYSIINYIINETKKIFI